MTWTFIRFRKLKAGKATEGLKSILSCLTPEISCDKNIEISSKSRVIYLSLALFLGWLGVHNFYSGHIIRGIIKLAVCPLFFTLFVPCIIGILITIEAAVTERDASGRLMIGNNKCVLILQLLTFSLPVLFPFLLIFLVGSLFELTLKMGYH